MNLYIVNYYNNLFIVINALTAHHFRLWVKYSKGKFGFSVQKKIYQSLGGIKEYDRKVWETFGDVVGWRKGGKWLEYKKFTFSLEHYEGHLPGCQYILPEVGGGILFSRAETCRL